MPSVSGIAHVKEGAASIVLSPGDLNDRIINLKFRRRFGETFIIRSDYEAVFHRDGTVSFKRCTQKPTIKVSYKQVSNSVAIEVGIEVTNLTIVDGDTEGADNMFAVSREKDGKPIGNPVVECEIQMGYREQFLDWTAPQHKDDVEGFYSLSGGELYGRRIVVQILAGWQKSLPPDRVTFFQGIVGTMEKGLRWNWSHDENDLIDYRYGDDNFPDEFHGKEIESVLYQFITRRFVRPSISHYVETEEESANPEVIKGSSEKVYRQTVFIRDYKKYKDDPGPNALDRIKASLEKLGRTVSDALSSLQGVPFIEAREGSVTVGVKVQTSGQSTAPATDYKELELKDGIMDVYDANKYGVICLLSRTLRRIKPKVLYGYKMSEEMAEAIQKKIPTEPFNRQVNTLGGQLDAIQAHYPFLRWYQLTDGSFYFYHEKDSEADLWIDPFIRMMQKENTVPLPAIYDMTPSGTRTIRCPFYSFLSAMTTVVFQNRFMLGTQTSYFYPVQTNAFLVITASIDFCTTGDENMMEMMCVDMPPKTVSVDSETGRLTINQVEVEEQLEDEAEQRQEQQMWWTEEEITVTPGLGWNDIVVAYLQASPDFWPDGLPDEKKKLTDLADWNKSYFDGSRSRNSIENAPGGIGDRTDIKVPWLYAGEKVKIRFPYQPEYRDDERRPQ